MLQNFHDPLSGSFAWGLQIAVVCPCPLGEAEKSEEKGEKSVEKGKNRKKGEKCVKKGESHSDPIYTNPIKNLPTPTPKNGQFFPILVVQSGKGKSAFLPIFQALRPSPRYERPAYSVFEV